MNAFINFVKAQSQASYIPGKSISSSTGLLLTEFAERLWMELQEPKVTIDPDKVFSVIPAFGSINDVKITVKNLGAKQKVILTVEKTDADGEAYLVKEVKKEKEKEFQKVEKIELGINDLDKNGQCIIKIKGVQTSSKKENFTMYAKIGGQEKDKKQFTVFRVNLEVLTEGECPDAPENPDNPTKPVDIRKLKDFLSAYLEGSTTLGHHLLKKSSRNAILIKGTISPSGLKLEDFIRKSDGSGFDFKRIISNRTYLNDCIYILPDPNNRLDVDDDPNNTDEDLYADHDGDKDNLFIYSVDTPGISFAFAPDVKDVLRIRSNYKEYVNYKGQRASEDREWFSALSMKRTQKDVVEDDKTYETDKDNQIGEGTIELTIDLKKGDITIPFEEFEKIEPSKVVLPKDEASIDIIGKGFKDLKEPTVTLIGITPDAPSIFVSDAKIINDTKVTAKLNLKGIKKAGRYNFKLAFKEKIPVILYDIFGTTDGVINEWLYIYREDKPPDPDLDGAGAKDRVKPKFKAKDKLGTVIPPDAIAKPKITQYSGTAKLKPIDGTKIDKEKECFFQEFEVISSGTVVFKCEGDGKAGYTSEVNVVKEKK